MDTTIYQVDFSDKFHIITAPPMSGMQSALVGIMKKCIVDEGKRVLCFFSEYGPAVVKAVRDIPDMSALSQKQKEELHNRLCMFTIPNRLGNYQMFINTMESHIKDYDVVIIDRIDLVNVPSQIQPNFYNYSRCNAFRLRMARMFGDDKEYYIGMQAAADQSNSILLNKDARRFKFPYI